MAINIPKNDYVKQTESREWIVQGICESFLASNIHSIFHPVNDGLYRRKTLYIARRNNENTYCGFYSEKMHENDEYVRIYNCEVKEAFKELIKAGYHMFRVYEYNSWLGYVCSKKPYHERGVEVSDFEGDID